MTQRIVTAVMSVALAALIAIAFAHVIADWLECAQGVC
jgi:hypothetical protein